MMDPTTAYFLKKYYPNVIKWWLVLYNPEVIRIWPSKAEESEALRLEALNPEPVAIEEHTSQINDDNSGNLPDSSVFNATTGSYSGLYGQKPVDANTQLALDAIMNASNNQNNIDYLLSENSFRASSEDVIIPPEQEQIINEANIIYERLLREAAEDEAKKQAEIDIARQIYENEQT